MPVLDERQTRWRGVELARNDAVRALASLILASVGAYGFNFATDLVVGAMLRNYPSTVYHPFGIWSLVAVIAFLAALGARGPAWTVWAPCLVLAGIATHAAYVADNPHKWIVAAVVLGQTVLAWWAMRPSLARTEPEPE
jgi:hypothetical protein